MKWLVILSRAVDILMGWAIAHIRIHMSLLPSTRPIFPTDHSTVSYLHNPFHLHMNDMKTGWLSMSFPEAIPQILPWE